MKLLVESVPFGRERIWISAPDSSKWPYPPAIPPSSIPADTCSICLSLVHPRLQEDSAPVSPRWSVGCRMIVHRHPCPSLPTPEKTSFLWYRPNLSVRPLPSNPWWLASPVRLAWFPRTPLSLSSLALDHPWRCCSQTFPYSTFPANFDDASAPQRHDSKRLNVLSDKSLNLFVKSKHLWVTRKKQWNFCFQCAGVNFTIVITVRKPKSWYR